jgi:hypothetical protein
MAAKMLDFRSPKRTRIESPAQPTAEQMAMISANTDDGFPIALEAVDKPSARDFAN